VASSWIKEDILKHYHVPSEKIQVIPYGAPTLAYAPVSNENLERVRSKFDLKTPFFFYPAFTHRHKNHIRLLEALNLVREHHQLKTNLVCCGSQTDFWPEIEKTILSLNLKEHVKFLGFLSEADVKALYSLAEFVIIPTLFEASSLPVCEAWLEGNAVACSAVTSLPDQVGKAALLFNPLSVESIADAINTLTTDKNRRELLKQLGANRLSDFNWDRTARAYRALYRRAAGRLLSNEEKFLLSWDWMLHPDRVDQSPAV
jgi:glycosyltransferase involved in cell wall biosynthesis